ETAANVDEYILALEEARHAGWSTPRALVEKTLVQLDSIVGKPADQGPLWAPVAKYPRGVEAAKREDFVKRYRALLDEEVLPQLQRLADYASKEYRPAARVTTGIGKLPRGEAAYRQLVRINTTLDMTPEQVHA